VGQGLTHKAAEAAVGSRDSALRVHLNQDILGGVNVDLQHPRLVQRAIQQHEQALWDKAGVQKVRAIRYTAPKIAVL